MKPQTLLAGFVFILLSSMTSAQSLAWNDPDISDGACQPPPTIAFPTQIINTLKGLPQGFRVYLPFGNSAYFRWVYQKVNGGTPATDSAQLLATKPRVTFPSLFAIFSLAEGMVDVYGPFPTGKWYKVQAIPINVTATDLIVNIVAPSPGAAPFGFGGTNIPSRYVWADILAAVEWHCFEGGVQVFNVISLTPALTPQQISSITGFLGGYGFQPKNFMTMPYD
ncbi:hypothetical protein DYL59_28520 [Pseudomonas kairouanensis]|uniref:Uncharacterized protein n=1 Tax=Pseudomonas kairouanensis TaxID=2293832 RepID=A0A4Z0ADP9_9PSED|nr:hypothetical protein [Pseudomonas kairouanensis]TFY84600.1 hypothetical protein DYL59_28520 [Pseudomonas kairouanensis]